MARSDLLINLVRAGTQGDNVSFRRTVEAIVAEEKARQHHVLAERLSEYLTNDRQNSAKSAYKTSLDAPFNSVTEIHPNRDLHDLVLDETTRNACLEIIEEQQRSDILRAHGVEPRNRIIATGAPGNGKTSLAEAIAGELALPLLVVRYESIITSFLGETAARVSKMFDYVRTRRCVLFFDEFDAIGKERGDVHETGEIKRVVSSLLLHIDALPSYVIIFAATNHSELLDRAVWRRFQLRMELPLPAKDEIIHWMSRFEKESNTKFSVPIQKIAETLDGCSFAELEEFCTDIRRRVLLSGSETASRPMVENILKQWSLRAKVRQL